MLIVERSMDDRWLSNAFVVGDAPGGTCVFVDSGAPLEPLLEAIERERLTPTHVMRTHGHADHVEHEEELASRFGIPVETGGVETGGLRIEAIPTPGTRTTASPSSSTTRCASRATRSFGMRSAEGRRTSCGCP